MPICEGCHSVFTESGYSRHLAQTTNPSCVDIYEEMHTCAASETPEQDGDTEEENDEECDNDEENDEEVDNDAWVAEQEDDWEPPIPAAGEQALNEENFPMDEDTPFDLDGQCTRRLEAVLPLHQGPYITKFPLHSAGAIIEAETDDFDESTEATHRYQSYQQKLNENNSIWAPFTSRIDYEVARWAKLRGQGSTAFSDLLDIEGVSY